jgi:spermidine synthase
MKKEASSFFTLPLKDLKDFFMTSTPSVQKSTYGGLFLIALSTLMYEILLTRIFSVTMWYHFAFMALSIAMFGMTVGALWVYLKPSYFSPERVKFHLSCYALAFSVSTSLSFLIQIYLPVFQEFSSLSFLLFFFRYVVITIPFVFSGVCICLALTQFPQKVGLLYGVDLAGAALGCILLIGVLELTDGPTAVFVVSTLMGCSAFCFALDSDLKNLKRITAIATLALCVGTIGQIVSIYQGSPMIRIQWVKGYRDHNQYLFEKWNSFSRVTVDGDPEEWRKPFGWGLSSTYPKDGKVQEINLRVDSTASTMLTRFNGDLKELWHFKYDVTNMAHYIRPEGKILIIGSGGGRDILSAMAFDQKEIVAVEINENIIKAVVEDFAEFTGNLQNYPQVHFVCDEARSYMEGTQKQFDILQFALADTFAATAAGAYVLTETSLYTQEAWHTFFNRLSDRGVLSFTRWSVGETPYELYRMVSLATEVLMQRGVQNPRDHLMVIQCLWNPEDRKDASVHHPKDSGVGTILISKNPFTSKDLETLEKVAADLKFRIAFSPTQCMQPDFLSITDLTKRSEFVKHFPVNITAPTDNAPFFFHMLRFKDVLNEELMNNPSVGPDRVAIFTLVALFFTIFILTLLCILFPLLRTFSQFSGVSGSKAIPLLFYFAGIGLGFMLVEVSQMQRLVLFLGHPIYGLSVVLFSLLLFSGLGSMTTQKVKEDELTRASLLRFLGFGLILALFGKYTPEITTHFYASSTMVRIGVSVGILSFLGFFMGMLFPLGMKWANRYQLEKLTPWFWGVNGATSVCASVLGIVLALQFSISFSFWMGVACYGMSFLALLWLSRQR